MDARQKCATCAHWQRMGARLSSATRDPGAAADTGTCQVRAPVVVQGEGPFPVSLFPVTHETRHCGDWASPASDGPNGGERASSRPHVGAIVLPIRKVA